jgi:hypothetical protein
VSQPDVAPFWRVTTYRRLSAPRSAAQLARLAAISCSFQRYQLVLHVVHLDQSGTCRSILEMKRYRFQHVTAEFIPSFTLGENGVAQRAGVEGTLVGIVNLEDQFQGSSISNPNVHGWPIAALQVKSEQCVLPGNLIATA